MPHRPLNILFICSGNIMRSVISECLLVARARESFEADGLFRVGSCGLEAVQDMPPHQDAVAALDHLGVPLLDTSADRVTGDHLRQCDLAVTMTRQQSYVLASRFPDERGKCFSMMEINGAIETHLDILGTTLEARDWMAEAREMEPDVLREGMGRAVVTLQHSIRELMRPLAGVPLNIIELLTLFSPCFYQVSGVHDPIGGTRQETLRCASILDREVTMLLRGLVALAVENGVRPFS